jgi:DNA replication protein DnaC
MRESNKLAAQRRAGADAIVIDNPRAQLVRARAHYQIEHARSKSEGSTLGSLLVGPTQSGKSTILGTIANELNTPEALSAGQVPVLLVTLDEAITRKQLAQNILEALELNGIHTESHRGNEAELLRRVRVHLRAVKCLLLVLDEFHHVRHTDSKRVANSVGETIKRMLISGVCPIIMSGKEESRLPFVANAQLSKRCLEEIALEPLNVLEADDQELFMGFLDDYLVELERREIVKNASDLLAGDLPSAILSVTDGVLGDACNLIKHAIDETTWAGRDRITREDLAIAARKHFKSRANPFETEKPFHVRETRSSSCGA